MFADLYIKVTLTSTFYGINSRRPFLLNVKLFTPNGRNVLIVRTSKKKVNDPKLRWNSDNNGNNKNYCLHNLIKYGNCYIVDIEEIQNKSTSSFLYLLFNLFK